MTHRLFDLGRKGVDGKLEFPFEYRPAVATDVRETWRLARELRSTPGTEPIRLDLRRKPVTHVFASAQRI
jgi:hypothetical protein